MIEKLDEKSLTWNASDTSWVLFGRALYHKQCEIISHLNTQEEKVRGKAYHEGYADGKIYADITASNQSNTCKECKGKGVIPHYLDYKDSRQEHYCEDCDGTGIKPTTLPQKIKLLKDRAGYPAGEYTDIIKATSGQGIRSEVTDGEATVNFMQYADEPAPDMRDVKTTVAGPPCKACYGKKQHTQLHGYRARGEEYGMKVHMNDCKRCNATGIEPTTESVSRTIDNSKILTKEKAQVHELMKELKEKEVEPTTGSVSTVEQETVGAGLLEGKKRKEEYISKLTTPDPYEECAKEILQLELKRKYKRSNLSEGMVEIIGEEKIEAILKKHFPTAL